MSEQQNNYFDSIENFSQSSLESHQNLHIYQFEHCLFGGTEELLSASLEKCLNLETLNIDFYENWLGDIGAEHLGRAIGNCLKLQNLELSIIRNKISQQGAIGLFQNLGKLKELQKFFLNLSDNLFQNDGLLGLGTLLGQCPKLQVLHINLRQNLINDVGVSSLCQVLESCSNLKSIEINLSYNDCESLGIRNLSFTISNLSQLYNLRLVISFNSVGNDGLLSICNALIKLTNLSTFFLHLSGLKSITNVQVLSLLNIYCSNRGFAFKALLILRLSLLEIRRNLPRTEEYPSICSLQNLLSDEMLILIKIYQQFFLKSSSESETIQDISQEFKNDIVLPSFQTKKFGSCESNLLSNRLNNQQSSLEKQQNKQLIDLESNNAFLAQKKQENDNNKMNLQNLKKSKIQFNQTLRNEKSERLDQRKCPSLHKKENYTINIKIDDNEIQSQKSQILGQAISQKLKWLQSASIKQTIQNAIFKCNENCKDLDVQSQTFLDSYQKTKGKLSYYEKQFFIQESQALQDVYVKKFFKKYDQDKKGNQIDNRIISSIFNNAK
ncbi:hypothetical protein ABPG74_019094 [Tetrahymena malaccensis]